MKRTSVMIAILCCGMTLAAAAGEVLAMQRIYAPNLLQNADCARLDGAGKPEVWRFDNCSRSSEFNPRVIRVSGDSVLAVDSGWLLFGYWCQSVPVEEGKRYYAAADFQSDGPNAMMWLKCQEYQDGGSPLGHYPPSQTEFYLRGYPHQGAELKKVLDDFINPEWVSGISAEEWTQYALEFTVPLGKGARNYAVRLGVYGGNPGQVRFRKPVLRLAESQLKVTVTGKNWTQLRIAGAQPETVNLDAELETQTVQVTLPSEIRKYHAELTGNNHAKVMKEISHE